MEPGMYWFMRIESHLSRRRTLGESHRQIIAAMIQQSRPVEVARALGVHAQTVLAVVAGQRVNHSTALLLEAQLSAVQPQVTP